jgi:simple sugar transport system ATP-binding protein
MIPQRLLVIPTLTVLENLFLGHEDFRRLETLDWNRARETLARLMATYGLEIPLEGKGRDLSVGQAQRLQILRALIQGARVLLCDEPTSVLAPPEVQALFATLARLRDEGVAVVFITHKLAELSDIADDVTVLRAGRVVGSGPARLFDRRRLAELIVGPRRIEAVTRRPAEEGGILLEIDRLRTPGPGGLNGLDLAVSAGRIVGIAGVEGNGQRELLEILGGIRSWEEGRVRVGRELWEAPGPVARRRIDAIPDDRLGLGLIPDLSLRDNVLLGFVDRRDLFGAGWIRRRAVDGLTGSVLEGFGVEPAVATLPVDALSGGNQQRLLVGREIIRGGDVLVASQPTQGVDVASRAAIHGRLLEDRRRGRALLLISSDLEELVELSDEIAVLFGGRILYRAQRRDVDLERVSRAMVGWAGVEDPVP